MTIPVTIQNHHITFIINIKLAYQLLGRAFTDRIALFVKLAAIYTWTISGCLPLTIGTLPIFTTVYFHETQNGCAHEHEKR